MEENMTEIEALKAEATELGIKFNPNIGADKLQAKIDALKSEDSEESTITDKTEKDIDEAKIVMGHTAVKKAIDPRQEALLVIKKQELENRKSIVVKISMVDKIEASTATSWYFGTGSTAMNVPLDTWVEMPKILVEMAEDATSSAHMDGLDRPKRVKKFVVEYKK